MAHRKSHLRSSAIGAASFALSGFEAGVRSQARTSGGMVWANAGR